ncbi:MAG TPA: type II CAAX endopeptidase family protein [Candidatus Angelobacter sp.]|jgi:membrane protease YdiL (CAAX protease family)
MASTTTTQQAPEPSAQQSPADRRRRWEDLALVGLIGFLPLVISGTYLLFVPYQAPASVPNYRYATGLVRELSTLLLFAVLLRRQGRRLSNIGLSFHWLDILKGAGLAFGAWIFSFLVSSLISVIYSWSGSQPHYRDPEKIFGSGFFVLVLAYTVLAPFFEEILVRGYMMTELIDLSWPVWLATLASVALQTSYHLYYGVAGALIAGSTFLISAIYFARTRNLTPVVLQHLFWNLAVTHWHH